MEAAMDGDVANPGLNVANYDKSADWNFLDGNVTTVGGCGPLSTSYWGTYDQGGNVAEWVETLTVSTNRVIRGGSWFRGPRDVRFAARNSMPPHIRGHEIGFRIARDLE